ncbi:MAG: peptide-methionine (R)-S-oxide reductase, partial [Deinococcales bacterium]|nr:peptide-methionine (R)-S-oxide reductase [Chitinophagaceae bacterium]
MNDNTKNTIYSKTDITKVVLKEEEWKEMLSPDVYY